MGKPKYIETPEKMWELFLKYAEETKSSPILVQDFVGKDGDEVYRKKERPLTLDGFSIWLFKNNIVSEVWQYFSNLNGAYNDYLGICRAIKEYIRTDQIEGGMAGIYNPSITQRLNGLTEKADLTLREQPIFKGINLDVTENNSTD
jgi:hypothetical protein